MERLQVAGRGRQAAALIEDEESDGDEEGRMIR